MTNYELEYEQLFWDSKDLPNRERDRQLWLNETLFTDVFFVVSDSLQSDSYIWFKNFCKQNEISYFGRQAYMTKEEYLMFSLSGSKHQATFCEKVSNLQYYGEHTGQILI